LGVGVVVGGEREVGEVSRETKKGREIWASKKEDIHTQSGGREERRSSKGGEKVG